MAEFRSVRDGGARVLLDDAETEIMRSLIAELRGLLDRGHIDRGDPVYDRLFPSAYKEANDEKAYRDLIGDDLTAHKLQALDALSAGLGSRKTDVTLTDADLERWLAALTDIRLAIGVRIEVNEEQMAADIDPSDPNAGALAVLHWLGYIQEGVLRAGTAT